MSNEQIIKEVNKELDQEKLEELKKQVRAYKLEQLELQEKYKAEKEKVEEKLRIVKLNLENLDKGDFSAIEDRMKKSEIAKTTDIEKRIEKVIEIWKGWFPIQPFVIPTYPQLNNPWITWYDSVTNGTFNLENGKTFYC